MTDREARLPRIVEVAEMPPPRRGRPRGVDLTPLIESLRDGRPHALEDIESDEDRKHWRRRLRQAARAAGLGIETSYAPDERRLYFRGIRTTSA